MKKNRKNKAVTIAITLTGIILLNGCSSSSQQVVDNIFESTVTQNTEMETSQETDTENENKEINLLEKESKESDFSEKEDKENNLLEKETEKTAIENEIPQVSIQQTSQNWYTDDGKVLLLEESLCSISIINNGFDKLADALSSKWPERQTEANDTENSLLEYAKDHYNSIEEDDFFPSYYSYDSISIGRVDSNVLSLIDTYSDYSGGAHGMYGTTGYTYDVQSGEELTLSDLLIDEENFYDAASEYVIAKLEEEFDDELFPEYKETVKESFENGANYYLDASGIVVIYNVYEVGPYVIGDAKVTLPYKEFSSYIKEQYLAPQGRFAAHVPENMDFSTILGSSGTTMVEVINDDDEFSGITIIAGTSSDESIDCEYFEDAYVFRTKEGKNLLILSADYASDDYVTAVYDVTENNLQKLHTLEGVKITGKNLSSDNLELEVHLDVLGTYNADMTYTIEEDGALKQSGELFDIHSSFKMTVTKELPVTIDGKESTLAKDSTLTITGTNNIDTAYFITSDGIEGAITYTFNEEEWTHYINGISEYEYFEMIPYAG